MKEKQTQTITIRITETTYNYILKALEITNYKSIKELLTKYSLNEIEIIVKVYELIKEYNNYAKNKLTNPN